MDTNNGNDQQTNKPVVKPDGPQGVDKAPGEETATNTNNEIRDAQKGKKVDADITNSDER